MDSFFQYRSRCALQNEFFHLLEFSFTSGFESARVVEDEIWVASEHQFILNFMVSALIEVNSCQNRSVECVSTYIAGGLHDGGIDLIAIECYVNLMSHRSGDLPSSPYDRRSRVFLWCCRLSEGGWSCPHLLVPQREFESDRTSF